MKPVSAAIATPNTTSQSHVEAFQTAHHRDFTATYSEDKLAIALQNTRITDRKVKIDELQTKTRFIISSDRDRQAILQALRQSPSHSNNRHLLYIDSVQALDTQGLLKAITIDQGQCKTEPGYLLRPEPRTVVIDLTAMRTDDIASMNDLLDHQPSCQGQPLGANIRRILITNRQTTEMLGQDYWRRARRFPQADIPDPSGPVLTDEELLQAHIQPLDPSSATSASCHTSCHIVDFYLNSDWRTPLVGGLELSGAGITRKPGVLTRLQPGSTLVLRNAPWRCDADPDRSSSDFDKTLATVLREQGFELYGRWYRLPDNLTLYRDDTSAENIDSKKAKYQVELDPDATFIRVNQATITFLDNPTRINDQGYVEHFNPLAEWANACAQIRITETLSLPQWLTFFKYYDQLEPDKRPALVMDDRKTHREETNPLFRVEEITDKNIGDLTINVQEAETDWDNLFQEISLKSRRQNRYFKEKIGTNELKYGCDVEGRLLNFIKDVPTLYTSFIITSHKNNAISVHRSFKISGIEANSLAAKKFATLNENPSYLFIHGKKVILDNAYKCRMVSLYDFSRCDGLYSDLVFKNFYAWDFPGTPRYKLVDFLKKMAVVLSDTNIQKLNPQKKSLQNQLAKSLSKRDFVLLTNQLVAVSYNDLSKCNESPLKENHHYLALLRRAQRLIARPWRAQPNHYGYILCQLRLAFPEAVEYPLFDRHSLAGWFVYKSPRNTEEFRLSGYRPPVPKADRDGLRLWLARHPKPNPESLQKHFWSLARYCPVWTFTDLPDTIEPPPGHHCLKQLAHWLVGAAGPELQDELADHLKVTKKDYKDLRYYSGQTVKQLSRWLQLQIPDLFLNKDEVEVKTIFAQLCDVTMTLERSDLSDSAKIKLITPLLTQYITENGQLPPGSRDFPHALVYGHRHGYLRQQLRLHKLVKDMEDFPVIFLTGETGAGKSQLAETAALKKSLKYQSHHTTRKLTLGPQTTREDLFGREVIKKGDDGDEYSVFVPGPMPSMNKNDTLVLNEANLVRSGVLSKLSAFYKGFWYTDICVYGSIHELDNNNIILTGNPDEYQGRRLDPDLTDFVLQLDIPPMGPDELARGIIRPALPKQWSTTLKGHICATILALLRQYQRILPNNPVNPREIKELLAIINHALACNKSGAAISSPDIREVNGLIMDAFRLALDHRIPPEQQEPLRVLQQWSQTRFPENSVLLAAREQQFGQFRQQLRARNPDIALDVLPFVALIQQYWLTLNKGDTGRTALLVEGPSGWGKDLLLDRVLALWNEQQCERSRIPAIHLTGSNGRWDHLSETIRQAARTGQIIAISELNLIDTAFLEGLLNDILTGEAVPGFRLIATVNPASFAGRKPLSPALKNRFARFELSPLGRDDIARVLTQLPGTCQQDLVSWLTLHFANLCEALSTHNSTLAPAMAELYEIVTQLRNQAESLWPDIFAHYFHAELMALDISVAELGTLPPKPLSSAIDDPITFEMPDESEGLATLSGLPDYLINPEQYGLQDSDLIWPAQPTNNRKSGKTSASSVKQMPTSIAVTGNITGHHVYQSRQRFTSDHYSPRDYRLGIYTLTFNDQGVTCDRIDPASEGVLPITVQRMSAGTCVNLHPGEVLGGQCVVLNHKSWYPLPGLSPMDEVTAIQCRHQPELKLDLARSKGTGQLLVRLAENFGRQEVQLDFVIKPSEQPVPEHFSHASERLLDAKTHRWLHKKLFNQQNLKRLSQQEANAGKTRHKMAKKRSLPGVNKHFQPFFNAVPASAALLRQPLIRPGKTTLQVQTQTRQPIQGLPEGRHRLMNIAAIPDTKEKINALANWLRSFRSDADVEDDIDSDIEKDVKEKKLKLLLNLIDAEQGVCGHRAIIFELVARYFGVPARQVRNDSHSYVEYSPNRGQSWHKLDLGGGGNYTLQHSSEDLLDPGVIKPVPLEAAATDAVNNKLTDTHDPEALPAKKVPPAPQAPQVKTEDVVHWLNSVDSFLNPRQLPQRRKSITGQKKQISTVFQSEPFIQTLQQKPAGKALVTKALRLTQTLSDLPGNPVHRQLQLLNIFFASPWRPAALFTTAADLITKAKDDLPCADILLMLEAMTGYSKTRVMALEHINRFYQTTFSKTCVWHLNKVPPPNTADVLPSSFLDRILVRSIPATEWSPVPTGRPPSVERMVTGLDAYPKSCSVQGGRNPAIIHLQGPWLKQLQRLVAPESLDNRETDEVLPRKQHLSESSASSNQRPVDSDRFTAMLYQFLYWLGTQDHKSEWCWLVSRPTTKMTGEAAAIAPGCYQTPPPLPAVEALLQTAGTGVVLNPSRLRPVLKKNEGVLLTSKHMDNLFREFLQCARDTARSSEKIA